MNKPNTQPVHIQQAYGYATTSKTNRAGESTHEIPGNISRRALIEQVLEELLAQVMHRGIYANCQVSFDVVDGIIETTVGKTTQEKVRQG